MDLNKLINDSLQKIEQSGFVEKKIQENMEKIISSIVSDIFSSYSEFGKNLKTDLESKLKINLSELKLDGQRELIFNQISSLLTEIAVTDKQNKIKERLKRILGENILPEYDLSSLLEEFKDHVKRDCDDGSEITLFIDRSEGGISDYVYIYIDPEEGKSKYSCKYKLAINSSGIWSLEIDQRDLLKNSELGCLFGFDDLLFNIYAAGSKIVLDKGDRPGSYDLYISYDC